VGGEDSPVSQRQAGDPKLILETKTNQKNITFLIGLISIFYKIFPGPKITKKNSIDFFSKVYTYCITKSSKVMLTSLSKSL
jgi:hypothetical protein